MSPNTTLPLALALALLCSGFGLGCLTAADKPSAEVSAPAERIDEVVRAARVANDAYQRHVQRLRQIVKSQDDEKRPRTIRFLALTHEPDLVPTITEFLDIDVYSLETVKAACYALVALDAVEASQALRKLSLRNRENENEKERLVRLAALNALHQLQKLGNAAYIKEAQHKNRNTRAMGVTDVATFGLVEAGDILAKALRDDHRHIRRMAAIGLGKLGNTAYGEALIEALADSDALVRRYAAEALARLDYKPAIPYMLIALEANRATGNIIGAVRHLTNGEDFGFEPFANRLDRTDAIERGFVWWNENKDALLR